jgi:hypothetical protein
MCSEDAREWQMTIAQTRARAEREAGGVGGQVPDRFRAGLRAAQRHVPFPSVAQG